MPACDIDRKTEEIFKLIPATINTVERCSGHAGLRREEKISNEYTP
jgi:hypothetical protein